MKRGKKKSAPILGGRTGTARLHRHENLGSSGERQTTNEAFLSADATAGHKHHPRQPVLAGGGFRVDGETPMNMTYTDGLYHSVYARSTLAAVPECVLCVLPFIVVSFSLLTAYFVMH